MSFLIALLLLVACWFKPLFVIALCAACSTILFWEKVQKR